MNNWQDIVLGAGSLIFVIALLPSVLSKNKPSIWTSATTGAVLTVFAGTYASLSLWYAAVTTLLAALLWGVLVFQKILQPK